MARYRLSHTTTYTYAAAAVTAQHQARLHPRAGEQQHVSDFQLRIHPRPPAVRTHRDYFGNLVHTFALEEPHDSLEVTASSEVEVRGEAYALPDLTPSVAEVRTWVAANHDVEAIHAAEMTLPSCHVPLSPAVHAYAAPFLGDDVPVLRAALDLAGAIHRDFTFDPNATDVSTPVDTFLQLRKGVCQDFTHLMIAGLRSHGIPARYVSGYIRTYRTEERADWQGADASHAWVAICLPGVGWSDVDPTNFQLVGHEHITVSHGRDFRDVSMIRGVMRGGGEHQVAVAVTVEPVT